MPLSNAEIKTLKAILENSLQPEKLDTHPWTEGLFARESAPNGADGQAYAPGQRLVAAIGKLFCESMPSAPPRQGKRLDTRWGEFGLLAARYFAPLLFGAPVPTSLRDAWGHIDQSLLLFVYGKPADALAQPEKEPYRLVGDEPEVAPHSTLSDWHRKGLQRLLEAILAREAYLLQTPPITPLPIPAAEPETGQARQKPGEQKIKKRPSVLRRLVGLAALLILLGLLAMTALKAWQVYNLTLTVRADATRLQGLLSGSGDVLERVRAARPELGTLRQDLSNLRQETEPYFWLGPWLKEVPQYGAELAAIRDLADLAETFLAAADISSAALAPLLEEEGRAGVDPARIVQLMQAAQPQLAEAQQALQRAVIARGRIDAEALSPQVRGLIVDDIDPLISLMQDGLSLAMEIPRALGASNEGPKTYLLLALNEDELRPDGGFITAAGTLLVQDGKIRDLSFKNSGSLEDWTKPYPAAPWQLNQYMNSPVLVLRDSSWFTDYPTSALYAEYLYSYVNNHSVDGVIAFNQQLLVKLLDATGPLQLDGVAEPVDSANVTAYMRAAKTGTPAEKAAAGYDNKAFINQIAGPLVEKLLSGEVDPKKLAAALLAALEERDVLLQVDNPALAALLARYEWDGAVRPGEADFLMVADSNIGFNKTNALVETGLLYEVDLTRPALPTAALKVTHRNNAAQMFTCKQWNKIFAKGEKDYPINDCYWNYMRIYRAAGTTLLEATPQFIPANWMLNFVSVPPRVDKLDEEIEQVEGFGTLQVIPGGQSLESNFLFALPPNSIQTVSGASVYRLKVKKQPGTRAVPLDIRVHFSPDALIEQIPDGAVIEGNTVIYPASLRTDLDFEITFSQP